MKTPLTFISLFFTALSLSACPGTGYGSLLHPAAWGFIGILILIYSAYNFVPAFLTQLISKGFSTKKGRYLFTYFGSWAGGLLMLGILLFIGWQFRPVLLLNNPWLFLIWTIFGNIFGGFMGYQFMAREINPVEDAKDEFHENNNPE